MQSRNTVIVLIAGAAAVCTMSAALINFSSHESPKSGPANAVSEQSAGVQPTARLSAGQRASGAAANPTAEPAEAPVQSDRQTTSAARPDEPMSPDQFDPNPLHQMGADLQNHPVDLAKLMDQLITETDPEKIMLLAQLIADNAEAAGLDLPIDDLLKLTASTDPLKRQAALVILANSSNVTPKMIDAVSGLARTDADNDTRLMAIKAMGDWMNRESTLSEQLSMEIIGARDASTHPDIRAYAIQTVGLQKNGLPQSMVAPMVESLRVEAIPGNRSLAALALSHAEPAAQPQALQSLTAAYQSELDLDARRHLITMIMRTAGPKAPDILKRLPADNPLLRQDVNDYVEIINSGETDINRIYDLKNQRDGDRGTEIISKTRDS